MSCNDVARDSIDIVETNHNGLEIHFETEVSDDFRLLTNQLYLSRSIVEILHNSAKFSDGKHITLRVTQTDTTVRYIVEDKGPGLSKNWEELISLPFTQGFESAAGLGLGLPLVKRHLTNLGGELIYDVEYVDGCPFIIEVPKLKPDGGH